MPSQVRSTCWFVRVDGAREYLQEKANIISGWIDVSRMLCMYHQGGTKENPHCHFVIQLTSELQKQSFASRIKTLYGIDKKSNYSVKEWGGQDAACSYMFHESEECVLVSIGFNDEDLARFRKLNEQVQKCVAVNKDRSPGRVVDKVVAHFAGQAPSRDAIIRQLLAMIRKGEMYEPGNYQLEKYVEEIYLKTITTEDEWEYYVAERSRKILSRLGV